MSDKILDEQYRYGVNHGSSTAAGQAQAQVYGYPTGRDSRETHDDYVNRTRATEDQNRRLEEKRKSGW